MHSLGWLQLLKHLEKGIHLKNLAIILSSLSYLNMLEIFDV